MRPNFQLAQCACSWAFLVVLTMLGTRVPQTAIEKEDAELIEIIKPLFKKSRKNYRTRRIKKALLDLGRHVSRRRIGRLMGDADLACKTKRKFIATTNSNHQLPIAANLLDRQFTVQQPNQTSVGDITYIYTLEGWLYLAVVIDLYSRQVNGRAHEG